MIGRCIGNSTGTMDTKEKSSEPKKVLIVDEMAVFYEIPFQHGNNATCLDIACAFISLLKKRLQS